MNTEQQFEDEGTQWSALLISGSRLPGVLDIRSRSLQIRIKGLVLLGFPIFSSPGQLGTSG